MKQTIEINVPEGFKAVWNENTQQIDLVKIDNRPRSWEEFCETHRIKEGEAYISNVSIIGVADKLKIGNLRHTNNDRNWCTSKQEAEAFLALMQLRQLRKVWIGKWEPIWNMGMEKFAIERVGDDYCITSYFCTYRSLSFPTLIMAEEFIECFKDLLETAKILL